MSEEVEAKNLQEIIREWAELGKVDISAWQADDILTAIAESPEVKKKFVAMLELRLNGALQ